jgi:hypothetical protein
MTMANKNSMNQSGWPPRGKWLTAKEVGPRRVGKRSGKSAPSRGRPRFDHPIVTLIQRSLASKSHQLGPPSRDRFSPFRKEFAMFYLARISPNVSLRVLKDVWPSEGTSQSSVVHPLGKVSIRTIQNAYLRAENEIRSAGLVSKLPLSWIRELKKHNLGPWNKTVPGWMAEAFRRDCKHLKLLHQAHETNSNQQSVEDGNSADHSESPEWQSEMRAQFDDITREIQELKVAAPGLGLVAEKLQIVWTACFSQIRKLRGEFRGEELVEHAADAEPKIDVSPSAKQTCASEEFYDEGEDAVISECIDALDDVIAAHPIESDRDEVSMLIPVWKRLRITDETTTIFEETPATNRSSPMHNRWKSRTEILGLSRKELGDDYQNQNLISNPSAPNRLVKAPDLTFPRLNLIDSERTMEEWRYFGTAHHPEIESRRGISGWIPKYHDGIRRLATRGYTLGVFYGSLGNRFPDSLTLRWIIERIIARVLNLEIDAVLDGDCQQYIPMAGIHGNIDNLKWESHGYSRGAFPITPLLTESLFPVNEHRGPKDHQWIPGWGFLPETELNKIQEFSDWIRLNPTAVKGKLTAHEQWARSIHLASHSYGIEICCDNIKDLGADYKGYLPMPMCTDYRKVKKAEVEWLDLSRIKGLWRSDGNGDSAIVEALKGFTTAIHMPTVRMIDSYYLQSSSKYFKENIFTDWGPIMRI